MTALYVTSLAENAGKTMLCAGLAKAWLEAGKKVACLKLADAKAKPAGDGDAAFFQKILGLTGPLEGLVSSPQTLKEDYARMAQDKEVVIIEGQVLGASKNVWEIVGARVVVIHDYASSLPAGLAEYKKIGKRLAGLVLNKVPQNKLDLAQNQLNKEIEQAGIKVLGTLPEDRSLLAMSVAEVAEAVHGKILDNAENSAALVENVMLGALAYDSGVDYFSRKTNKAVILRGDRPDMQLAALQTSLRCMVISGGTPPIPMVSVQARSRNIPLISAGGDVQSLAAAVEEALMRASFHQESKLPRLKEILGLGANKSLLSVLQ